MGALLKYGCPVIMIVGMFVMVRFSPKKTFSNYMHRDSSVSWLILRQISYQSKTRTII